MEQPILESFQLEKYQDFCEKLEAGQVQSWQLLYVQDLFLRCCEYDPRTGAGTYCDLGELLQRVSKTTQCAITNQQSQVPSPIPALQEPSPSSQPTIGSEDSLHAESAVDSESAVGSKPSLNSDPATGSDPSFSVEPSLDRLSWILRYSKNSIEHIMRNMHESLLRIHELRQVQQVNEVDLNSLIWLSRQPGDTLASKLQSTMKMYAPRRVWIVNTIENRVFKIFVNELVDMLDLKQAALGNLPEDVQELESDILHWTKTDAAQSIALDGVIRPNNFLLNDKHYRKVWDSWGWLRDIDDSYKQDAQNLDLLVMQSLFWTVAAILTSYPWISFIQVPCTFGMYKMQMKPLPLTLAAASESDEQSVDQDAVEPDAVDSDAVKLDAEKQENLEQEREKQNTSISSNTIDDSGTCSVMPSNQWNLVGFLKDQPFSLSLDLNSLKLIFSSVLGSISVSAIAEGIGFKIGESVPSPTTSQTPNQTPSQTQSSNQAQDNNQGANTTPVKSKFKSLFNLVYGTKSQEQDASSVNTFRQKYKQNSPSTQSPEKASVSQDASQDSKDPDSKHQSSKHQKSKHQKSKHQESNNLESNTSPAKNCLQSFDKVFAGRNLWRQMSGAVNEFLMQHGKTGQFVSLEEDTEQHKSCVMDLSGIRPKYVLIDQSLSPLQTLPYKLLGQFWNVEDAGKVFLDCGLARALWINKEHEVISSYDLFEGDKSDTDRKAASQLFFSRLSKSINCDQFYFLLPDAAEEFSQYTVRQQINIFFSHAQPIPRSIGAAFSVVKEQSEQLANHDRVLLLCASLLGSQITITPLIGVKDQKVAQKVPETNGWTWERYPSITSVDLHHLIQEALPSDSKENLANCMNIGLSNIQDLNGMSLYYQSDSTTTTTNNSAATTTISSTSPQSSSDFSVANKGNKANDANEANETNKGNEGSTDQKSVFVQGMPEHGTLCVFTSKLINGVKENTRKFEIPLNQIVTDVFSQVEDSHELSVYFVATDCDLSINSNNSALKAHNIHVLNTVVAVEGAAQLVKWQQQEHCPILWQDHLPELYVRAVINGMPANLPLVPKNTKVIPKFKQALIFKPLDFKLPAGPAKYSFNLAKKQQGATLRYKIEIKSPTFPLRQDLECSLKLKYVYGEEQPYQLFVVPVKAETAPFKQIEVDWVSDEGSVRSSPVPKTFKPTTWQELQAIKSKKNKNIIDDFEFSLGLLEKFVNQLDMLKHVERKCCDASSLEIRWPKDSYEFCFLKDFESYGDVYMSTRNQNLLNSSDPKRDLERANKIYFTLEQNAKGWSALDVVIASSEEADLAARRKTWNEKLLNWPFKHLSYQCIHIWQYGRSVSDVDAPSNLSSLVDRLATCYRSLKPLFKKAYFHRVENQFFRLFACMHEDCPEDILQDILKMSFDSNLSAGLKKQINGNLLGNYSQVWQEDLFEQLLSNLNGWRINALALAFWRYPELLSQLNASTLKEIGSALIKALVQSLADDSIKDLNVFTSHMELILALLTTRGSDSPEIRKVFDGNSKMVEQLIAIMEKILEINRNRPLKLKSFVSLDVNKGQQYAKLDSLLFAVYMYLIGDDMANDIVVTKISEEDAE